MEKRLKAIALTTPILYNIAIMATYGGSLITKFPDTIAYVAHGLAFAGEPTIYPKDMPPNLPIYIALIYNICGFENFLKYIWIWNLTIAILLILSSHWLAKQMFNEEVAALTALIVGFNWHLVFYAAHILTDAAVSALMVFAYALYWKIKEKPTKWYALLGFAVAGAFMTKFTAILIATPLILHIAYTNRGNTKKTVKQFTAFAAGFSTYLLPYLLYFQTNYQSILGPIAESIGVQREIEKHAWILPGIRKAINQTPIPLPILKELGNYSILFYLFRIPYTTGTIPFITAVYGGYNTITEKKGGKAVPIWILTLLLAYSIAINLSGQYIIHFSPYILLLSALGTYEITRRSKEGGKASKLFAITIIFILVLSSNSPNVLFVIDKTGKINDPLFLIERLERRQSYDDLIDVSKEVNSIIPLGKEVSYKASYSVNCLFSIIAKRPNSMKGDWILADHSITTSHIVLIKYWKNYHLYLYKREVHVKQLGLRNTYLSFIHIILSRS